MFITKKAIRRRTFLKGAGATLALPLLDAMIPAATAWARTPAKPAPRLGLFFGHHGRPDRGQRDWSRYTTRFTRVGDGSESVGRCVQQRLCMRVSELPLMVVADNAASG